MKRLFRIGLNILISSLMPILCYFLLGLTLNSNIANVFSITYPLQFISGFLIHIFGTGANVKAEKEKNSNSVLSGIIIGTVVGAIIFGVLLIFTKEYLIFMNVNVETYLIFARYSFAQMFLNMVFLIFMEKLYFENKDKKASIHTYIFNGINLVVLVGTSLMTKNELIITTLPLIALILYLIFIFVTNFKKFKLEFNILSNIRYESYNLVSDLFMFVSYLFASSYVFSYGPEFLVASNFITLITDAQWDTCNAMETVSKIDIVHNEFNIKRHMKNAFIFVSIIIMSVVVLFFSLFNIYNVVFKLGIVYMLFQVVDLLLGASIYVLSPFIQLKHSSTKNTIGKLIFYGVRMLLALSVLNPFRAEIGQITCTICTLIFYAIIIFKHFTVSKDGKIEQKI